MVPILVGGAAVYGATVGALYLLQESMLFPRHVAKHSCYRLPAHAERLTLRTADGHRIHGHLLRAVAPSRGLVLGFSGNAWNAGDCAAFLAQRLPDYDIVLFHYRGYPPSEGSPSEAALFADALLVHDTLVRGMRPRRVYAAGFSLGTGVAAYLARKRPLHGILLTTPFDSIEAVARGRYPWIPVRRLLKHPFRSDRHLAGTDIPVAVIAAAEDRVVPPARTEALRRVLRREVFHAILPATHSGIYDLPEIDDTLRAAFDALALAASGPGVASRAPVLAGPADAMPLAVRDPS